MVTLTIDKQQIMVPEGTTILQAAKKAGIAIPTLCYWKDINEVGACRVCVVEVKGIDKLVSSCNTRVEEGMEVLTKSQRVLAARRTNVEFILSQHHTECTVCLRNGNCRLQDVAAEVGVQTLPYEEQYRPKDWDMTFPLIRDASKCIQCMRCISECEKITSSKVWTLLSTGRRTTVGVRDNKPIRESNCTLCGQCITHCPVGALLTRDDTAKVFDAIHDPDTITIVQVAPAVRTAWAEAAGLPRDMASPRKMAAALRRLGFDYVFDTSFSADLTIMEESNEFLVEFAKKDRKWPMFTSCCPGWVRFMKHEYPDMVEALSTSKSPQQMFGAMVKSYCPEVLGIDRKKICSISVMPCVAKKYEAAVAEVNSDDDVRDIDLVITTREFLRMLKTASIDIQHVPEEDFDSPLGEVSGGGIIFGTTGGVMEAALRTAYHTVTGKNPDANTFYQVQSKDRWVEGTFNMAGAAVRIAVANGLGNARALVEAIRHEDVHYDFVEVMACPGGCSGGGGQPIHDGEELANVRGQYLHTLDAKWHNRFCHDNPEIQRIYADFLGKPLSEKAEHYLHTNQKEWAL